ncbi:MAG: hypothetical protein IJ480_00835 [Clostridia bacterium]|nr:hypothetical protein [Clostridia bacterium]
MNKDYIECLERIINLEEISHTQQETLSGLREKISSLGKPNSFIKPQKRTVVKTIPYYTTYADTSHLIDGEAYTSGGMLICAIIFGLFGLAGGIFSAIIAAVVGGIIGIPVGMIASAISRSNSQNDTKQKNEDAKKQAEYEAQITYENNLKDAENQYITELEEYEKNLLDDKIRVQNEIAQREYLKILLSELEKKHDETISVLKKFYNAANIYDTYRNIIAMCHIVEYLKSGICSELSGRDGAYMVFKYEMYEKKKIEQLETIINQLTQIHFDNQLLNSSLERIAANTACMLEVSMDIRHDQIMSAQKNEQMLQGLRNQLSSVSSDIRNHNSISEYNQKCSLNELQHIRWLEQYNTYFK